MGYLMRRPSMDERRVRTRVSGNFSATLLDGDREIPVRTLNLSLKGLLCAGEGACLDLVGRTLFAHLKLGPGVFVVLEARAVRCADGNLAVQFLSMPDESYAHLRNLVRLAASDADAIDSEQTVPLFADAGEDDFIPYNGKP
jgi:hypothetical protein